MRRADTLLQGFYVALIGQQGSGRACFYLRHFKILVIAVVTIGAPSNPTAAFGRSCADVRSQAGRTKGPEEG